MERSNLHIYRKSATLVVPFNFSNSQPSSFHTTHAHPYCTVQSGTDGEDIVSDIYISEDFFLEIPKVIQSDGSHDGHPHLRSVVLLFAKLLPTPDTIKFETRPELE